MKLAVLWLALLFLVPAPPAKAADYGAAENWAYREARESFKEADVFFVCPTVYMGDEAHGNMRLDDEKTKADFIGAVNMEKGIYDRNARFFAPYYRMAGLHVYAMPEAARAPYLALAYEDVRAAFIEYLARDNGGRPLILAGFSQGADHVLRLLREFFTGAALRERLVAAYAIGWRVTEADLAAHPHLRFASGERDTGVIVAYNTEAEDVTDSPMIPAGTASRAINPLNWRTDGAPARRWRNRGACFTDYGGRVAREVPFLTGAYIDGTRGALKAPDVSPADYPPVLPVFADGVYHIYDYQFFYRNLQENVAARIAAYRARRAA